MDTDEHRPLTPAMKYVRSGKFVGRDRQRTFAGLILRGLICRAPGHHPGRPGDTWWLLTERGLASAAPVGHSDSK